MYLEAVNIAMELNQLCRLNVYQWLIMMQFSFQSVLSFWEYVTKPFFDLN